MPTISKTLSVKEVEDAQATGNTYSNELIYLVKLDSKRFEARTLEQAIALIQGSAGVVNKITLERQ